MANFVDIKNESMFDILNIMVVKIHLNLELLSLERLLLTYTSAVIFPKGKWENDKIIPSKDNVTHSIAIAARICTIMARESAGCFGCGQSCEYACKPAVT